MSATQPTDRELVLAAQAGDVATLGMLLERHRASVLGACIRLLGHGPGAQDAVQDTCLVALRRLHELRDPDAFAGWLHAIARNACLMELRRSARERSVDEAESAVPSPEEELERHALRSWLWSALDELSEPLRVAVMLRYFGHRRSYEEIAQLCGVPLGTVRSRLSAARRALVDALIAAAGADTDVEARLRLWRERLAAGFAEYNRGDLTGLDAVPPTCSSPAATDERVASATCFPGWRAMHTRASASSQGRSSPAPRSRSRSTAIACGRARRWSSSTVARVSTTATCAPD